MNDPTTTTTITESLVDMLRRRAAVGLAKYGTTLDRTDLTLEDWLQHQLEELLDGAGYAMAALRQLRAAPARGAVPEALKYPGRATGTGLNHDYIKGWNACRDAMLAAAPQPAGEDVPSALETQPVAVVEDWPDDANRVGIVLIGEMPPVGTKLYAGYTLAPVSAAPQAAKEPRQPDGYAYRYPSQSLSGGTEIRFNGGKEVNGQKPIEAVPYYLDTPDGDWVRAGNVQLLVDQIDEALNGKTGRAGRASLCDIAAQVDAIARRGGAILPRVHDAQQAAPATPQHIVGEGVKCSRCGALGGIACGGTDCPGRRNAG